MQLIVDELRYLQLHGLELLDPRSHEPITVKLRLLFPLSDYPGLMSILGRHFKQSPAPHACPRSSFAGVTGGAKTIYNTHAK